ncbi:MAG: PorT family protein [Bacteroidales bacterium]|nr:PorT family protein [Bacteroidales bacterium]
MRQKLFLMLFIFSGILFSAKAQDIKLGIEFSPLVNWLNPDEDHLKRDKAAFNFDFGLNAEFYFRDNYAVVTGLYFNNQSGKIKYLKDYEFETSKETYTLTANEVVKHKMRYIRVPLGLKMKTNEIGYMTFYARLGLNSYFNTRSKATTDSDLFDDVNSTKSASFFHAGYFIGGGIEYSIGASALTAGVTYQNGFTNSFSSPNHHTVSSQVALNLGIIF